MLKYPALVRHEEGCAYGVTIVDLPGCFSAGDTIEEAKEMSKEAIVGHVACLLEDGLPIPPPKTIEDHIHHPEYKDVLWCYIEVDNVSVF